MHTNVLLKSFINVVYSWDRDLKIALRNIALWKIVPKQIPPWVNVRVVVRISVGGNLPGGGQFSRGQFSVYQFRYFAIQFYKKSFYLDLKNLELPCWSYWDLINFMI